MTIGGGVDERSAEVAASIKLIFVLYHRVRGKQKQFWEGDEAERMKNGLRRGSFDGNAIRSSR